MTMKKWRPFWNIVRGYLGGRPRPMQKQLSKSESAVIKMAAQVAAAIVLEAENLPNKQDCLAIQRVAAATIDVLIFELYDSPGLDALKAEFENLMRVDYTQ